MVASTPRRITAQGTALYEELDLRREFAHLLSGKSTKTAATRAALFDSSMHQIGDSLRSSEAQTPSWV